MGVCALPAAHMATDGIAFAREDSLLLLGTKELNVFGVLQHISHVFSFAVPA